MPSPDARSMWEFAAGWTSYVVEGPSRLAALVASVSTSTPQFRSPSHQVRYVIDPGPGGPYRLCEQGDEIGSGDESWIAGVLDARIRGRLLQIATLSGWAPLHGGLVDSGTVRSLVLTADPRDLSSALRNMSFDMGGQGIALVRPGRSALVGRGHGSMDAPKLMSQRPPDQVVNLSPSAASDQVVNLSPSAGSDHDDATRLSTPQLLEVILSAVVDTDQSPTSVAALAVESLATLPAWQVPLGDDRATTRVLATRAGWIIAPRD